MCKCGRIRKYGKWKFPTVGEKEELIANAGKIEKIDGVCPMCKVVK